MEEEVVDFRNAYVLTELVALHLRALQNYRDWYGNERKAGDEWVIHKGITDTHILDAYEQL